MRLLKLLFKSKTGLTGLLICLVVLFCATLGPSLTSVNPARIDTAALFKPPAWKAGGSAGHFLGTDNLGRDLFTRIVYGSRISLLVSFFSVIVAGLVGGTLGLLSGYYGGLLDIAIMRTSDAFMAIPRVLMALVILRVASPGMLTLIFVIGATNWVVYARLVRSEVLVIKEMGYVKAARTVGCGTFRIIVRHILPNVFSSVIVVSTLSVAQSIILEASMSFLGLGIRPPMVSWGGILADGRNYLASHWWIATFPGLAITFTVIGIMFLGNWLRDVLDPKNQGIV